jgi:hypothetical protein
VSSEPLGYHREVLAVGRSLPEPPDHVLQRAVERCGQVLAAFDGKLGDALLAFGAVAAVTDVLTLNGRTVPLHAVGRYGRLYPVTSPTPSPQRSTPRLIIGDEPGVALAQPTREDHVLICRPERARCFHDGRHAHPFLPARYYLEVERGVGVRLPGEPPFLPPLSRDSGVPAGEGLTIAAVIATSRPDRKDYGAERFAAAARIIGERAGRRVRLLLVPGREETARPPLEAADGFEVGWVVDAEPGELTALFAQCDVVLGNDTGLTHLAALSSARAEVVGLHGRHSHSKWRTGLSRHHALATPFSEHMHRRDLCPVRDGLHERNAPRFPLSSIPPAIIAKTAVLALKRGTQ